MYFKGTPELKLGPLATDPPSQLDILGHDGHPLGMDGAEHSVLKEDGEEGLSRLLKSQNGNSLEPEAEFRNESTVTSPKPGYISICHDV